MMLSFFKADSSNLEIGRSIFPNRSVYYFDLENLTEVVQIVHICIGRILSVKQIKHCILQIALAPLYKF
jgi:hypothetical protein